MSNLDDKEQKQKKTTAERLSEITEKLEKGVRELTNSDKYKSYLTTMSKFHRYSFNNNVLIAMQKPDATLVAGFEAWKNKFGRQVNKGEKGIKIIAPMPYKKQVEQEIKDKNGKTVLDSDGKPKTQMVEITIPSFQPVTVFDVAQTSGKELPKIGVDELKGKVENFNNLISILENVSPVPVERKEIESGAKGYFSPTEQKIVLQQNMSEAQEVKTLIHEISHSLVDDKNNVRIEGLDDLTSRTRNDKEVTAESVAFVVSEALGIDTSEYSFPYIASWSKDKDVPELKASMEIIRTTASEIIQKVENELDRGAKDRTTEIENKPEEKKAEEKETEVKKAEEKEPEVKESKEKEPKEKKSKEKNNNEKKSLKQKLSAKKKEVDSKPKEKNLKTKQKSKLGREEL